MSAPRRQISPEELAAVFALAAEYPDLRTVAADLTELVELRRRVKRGEDAIKGLAQSQTELRSAVAKVLGKR